MSKYEYWNESGALQTLEEIKKDVFILTQRSIAGDIVTLLAPLRKRPFTAKEKVQYIKKYCVDFFRIGEAAQELVSCFVRKYEKAS